MLEGDHNSWSLDFYTKRITPRIMTSVISDTKMEGKWLFVYEDKLKEITKNNLAWSRKIEINHFRITKLSFKFLNPTTRNATVGKAFLVQIK